MTSKAALCKALLDGKILNIKNGFNLLGITNIPREIGRSIEREFGVVVNRFPEQGVTRYGQVCNWVNYRLPRISQNAEGIAKMKAYVLSQSKEDIKFKYSKGQDQPPKKHEPELQQNLFL